MPTIVSKRNGMRIGIPPDARNIVRNFNTSGDNELIFEKSSAGGPVLDEKLSIDTRAPDKPAKSGKGSTSAADLT